MFPVATIVLFFLAFLHSYFCSLSVFSLLNRLVVLLCSTNRTQQQCLHIMICFLLVSHWHSAWSISKQGMIFLEGQALCHHCEFNFCVFVFISVQSTVHLIAMLANYSRLNHLLLSVFPCPNRICLKLKQFYVCLYAAHSLLYNTKSVSLQNYQSVQLGSINYCESLICFGVNESENGCTGQAATR